MSNLAGASEKCGSLERMKTALRLVVTLYPDLRDAELSIGLAEGSYTGGARPVRGARISMRSTTPNGILQNQTARKFRPEGSTTTGQAQQQKREVPLLLTFNFIDFGQGRHTVECHPVQFLNNRPTKMLEDARAEIDTHPAWTQDEALEAAKRHGLRFGPGDERSVLKLIPMKELGSCLRTLEG